MEYHYFFSFYFHKGDDAGHGNTSATTSKKITTFADLVDVQSHIKEKNSFNNCVILNFDLLNEVQIVEEEES
ncbi:MAG: hypothetical protein RIC57_09070 [Balneola sp.]